jgi:hypothetical protein
VNITPARDILADPKAGDPAKAGVTGMDGGAARG